MDRGTQSAGQRTHRAIVRNATGPPGKRNAPGGDRQPRGRQSFFGDAFSSDVGKAFHGGTSQPAQCASTVGCRTAAGRNSKRARGTPSGRRSHRQLGWPPLGRATRRSLRGSSWCTGGNRATTRWLALAPFPRPLSAPAPLPSSHAARGKSFRPTACRTHRPHPLKSLQKCSSQPPMADISIWQKTGHFYFALTVSVSPTLNSKDSAADSFLLRKRQGLQKANLKIATSAKIHFRRRAIMFSWTDSRRVYPLPNSVH